MQGPAQSVPYTTHFVWICSKKVFRPKIHTSRTCGRTCILEFETDQEFIDRRGGVGKPKYIPATKQLISYD